MGEASFPLLGKTKESQEIKIWTFYIRKWVKKENQWSMSCHIKVKKTIPLGFHFGLWRLRVEK